MPLAVRTVTDDGDDDGGCVGLSVGEYVVDCNRLTMLRSFVAVSDTLLTPLVVRAALW